VSAALPTLETDRLLLRPLEEGDLDAYAAIMADPEVVRYLSGETSSREDAWRNMATFLGHGVLRGWTNNAVVVRATGEFVGRCGLWQPENWPGLEVGWTLARSAWGHGYATEAAVAWRDWAFANIPSLDQLISVIHRDNARSIAVAARIGHRYLRDLDVRGHPCVIYGQDR
jgi:RimJ/RimL family protein N-acetyltransferase